jgi:hypothetical protein
VITLISFLSSEAEFFINKEKQEYHLKEGHVEKLKKTDKAYQNQTYRNED